MEITAANPDNVKALLDHMLECYNRFCDEHPEIETVDAFMAVHNFHVLLVLNIEQEYHLGTKQQLFVRFAALETFRQALENKPAFRQGK